VLCGAVLGFGGAALLIRGRMAGCAYVPLLADELLRNANLLPGDSPRMPRGWTAAATNGVALHGPAIDNQGFDLDGDGRALQLIGIANYVQTPPAPVDAGRAYCFAGQALSDSEKGATRLRVVFRWQDAAGQPLGEQATDWQPVVLWRKDTPPAGWSRVGAAFRAPAGAAALQVRVEPASDDRVYLDDMHIRTTTDGLPPTTDDRRPATVSIEPWPEGRRGALSLSFDWETAMGGLIHSRSGDPNSSQNALDRAMRMREGITTTLGLFRPYGIRATYYANGYNFLLGNRDGRQFMGNPIFVWASQDRGWPGNMWTSTPWFSKDPHGTVQSDPGWYFGDLIPILRRERQDIQSHTFSHFYGGYADAEAWRADLAAWQQVAAEHGVPPARSLAFPWSSSAGMSYTNWGAVEAAGITSLTRTNTDQREFQLADRAGLRCRAVPGHERILACPDFYLHSQETAARAIELIDETIATSGTIDLWAHTEEVTSPEQIANWRAVVGYAARQRDAGKLWIAPLAEIADWQQARAQVRLEMRDWRVESQESPLVVKVTNASNRDMEGLTLMLPFSARQATVDGQDLKSQISDPRSVVLNIRAGQTLEVQAWPA
jgi:hypothetical protein